MSNIDLKLEVVVIPVSVSPRPDLVEASAVPMSRVSRTRWNGEPVPLSEMAKFSGSSEPTNTIVSLPPCPSTMSLPSPAFHWKTSSPATAR